MKLCEQKNKMKNLFCLLVVATVLSCVLGQVVVNGPCSRFQVTGQQLFITKFLTGKWYVHSTIDYPAIAGLDCLEEKLTLNKIGNVDSVELGKNLTTNERKTIRDTLKFTQPKVGFFVFNDEAEVLIPSTDYKNYFIEFSCVDLPNDQAGYYVGVFTRKSFPFAFVVGQINKFLAAHNIDRTNLRTVVHEKSRCGFK